MNQLTEMFDGQDLTIITNEGEPKFSLKDVCNILEIGNPSQVKTRLDDGVISNEVIQDRMGRNQNATFINEDGLYDVILDSRKPEAKQFRKWITSEVLPSIRKQGMYMTNNLAQEITDNPEIIHYLAEQVAKINTANNQHHEQTNNKLETIDRKIEGEYASPQDIDAIKYAVKIKAEKMLESLGMQLTLDNYIENAADIYEQAQTSKRQKQQYRHDLGMFKSRILVETKKQLGMKGNAPNNHIRRKDVDLAVQIVKDIKRNEVSA